MIIHNVVQGSSAWLKLRSGRPTASEFSRIVTPKGKPSTAQENYLRELLAERIIGKPLERVSMPWMERGRELEEAACNYYEFQREVETEKVGFVTDDTGQIGASPDRLVNREGLVEIKCPAPATHIGYLMFNDHRDKYYSQLQGQLLVCEAQYKWVDICSYHPLMPTAIVRVDRDEDFISLLKSELWKFVEQLTVATEIAAERGYIHESDEENEDPLGVTNEDLEMILTQMRKA